jgi:ethanolamine ammonia-lyase small subunit
MIVDRRSVTQSEIIQQDPWSSLKAYTAARIALGSAGVAIPLTETLRFKMDHAHARDAVQSQLEVEVLQQELSFSGLPIHLISSKAQDRKEYLQRPDLGRSISDASLELLKGIQNGETDIAIIIADGLSAAAIQKHAAPLLRVLIPLVSERGWSLAPLTIVLQGRVAIGDDVGAALKAKMTIMLIGERPGLSSPDSMGAYLTYGPSAGLKNNNRNCVSNIRPKGLPYLAATDILMRLLRTSFALKISGVELKVQDEDIRLA